MKESSIEIELLDRFLRSSIEDAVWVLSAIGESNQELTQDVAEVLEHLEEAHTLLKNAILREQKGETNADQRTGVAQRSTRP